MGEEPSKEEEVGDGVREEECVGWGHGRTALLVEELQELEAVGRCCGKEGEMMCLLGNRRACGEEVVDGCEVGGADGCVEAVVEENWCSGSGSDDVLDRGQRSGSVGGFEDF